MNVPLYDVIAIRIDDGSKRVIASGKSERTAESILQMAAMRRGVEEEFYDVVQQKGKDEDEQQTPQP